MASASILFSDLLGSLVDPHGPMMDTGTHSICRFLVTLMYAFPISDDLPYQTQNLSLLATFLSVCFILIVPVWSCWLVWENRGIGMLFKRTIIWGPQDTRFWKGRYHHLRGGFEQGLQSQKRPRRKREIQIKIKGKDIRGLKGLSETGELPK